MYKSLKLVYIKLYIKIFNSVFSRYIISEPGEKTTKITQTQLSNSVDVTSAKKHFDLNLDFGPYE